MSSTNREPIYDNEGEGEGEEEYVGLPLQERKAQAIKRFEEKWLIDQGVNPYASVIGETLHPATIKSYEALEMQPQDHPYYASRLAFERMKNNLANSKNPPKVDVTINRIMRLKDLRAKTNSNSEYLVYDYTESLEDYNENDHHQDFKNSGVCELVQGKKIRDNNGKVTGSEIDGFKLKYLIPFSKAAVDNILKKNTTDQKPDLLVGYCRTKSRLHSRPVYEGRSYSILNLDDFKQGTFEQLYQLGERGLSEEKPSLSRLKQPILADPAKSLYRRNLPIQPVIAAQVEDE
jgi:hypothetical protein